MESILGVGTTFSLRLKKEVSADLYLQSSDDELEENTIVELLTDRNR